jgi:hypothetical protein
MNGGTISGNTTTGSYSNGGGGVYVESGKFTMNGGTISSNTSTGGNGYSGGGVLVKGTFDMNGGTISGNTALVCGGVFVKSGKFTMNGGTISGNKTTGDYNTTAGGGGVHVQSGATFDMNGGTIGAGNTADRGGGVFLEYESTFTMNGGAITGNDSINGGGGVYVFGIFAMNGGIISGNKATGGNGNGGGGVYVTSQGNNLGTFRMVTGTIYGSNEADMSLRNTVPSGKEGAALYKSTDNHITNYGTGESWPTDSSNLSTTNDTIEVRNGVGIRVPTLP